MVDRKCCVCEMVPELIPQPAQVSVSYIIPSESFAGKPILESVGISAFVCERHKADFIQTLKWYLVSEGLWYPDCIIYESIAMVEELING